MALKKRRIQQLTYLMAMPEPPESAKIKYLDPHLLFS
jgi:hypothetical protein